MFAKVGKFLSRKRRIHGWLIHPFFLSLLHFPFFLSLHTLLNSIPSLFLLLLLPLESQEILSPLPSSSSSFCKLSFVVIGEKSRGEKKTPHLSLDEKKAILCLTPSCTGFSIFFTLQSTKFPARISTSAEKKAAVEYFPRSFPVLNTYVGMKRRDKEKVWITYSELPYFSTLICEKKMHHLISRLHDSRTI